MDKNLKKFYINSISNNLILLLFVGSMIQTFLLENGYRESLVNIYTSVMQMVQILTILAFSKRADNMASIKGVYSKSYILQIPLIIAAVMLCFFNGSKALLLLFFIASFGFNVACGIHNILAYKQPYLIMPMSHYGKASALSGLFGGIASLLFSFILLLLQKKFSFFEVMRIAYIISLFFPIFCSKIIASYDEKEYTEKQAATKAEAKNKINLFKYKPFSLLMLPNLARGFCFGIIGMAITIGYYTKVIDVSSTSYLIVITNFINISCPLLYSCISEKIEEKKIIICSSIAVFLFMPLMLMGKTTAVFLVFYGIAYFFVNMINYSVPVAVVKIVSYENMGQYSAGRMIIHTMGASIAGFVCIPMFKLFGPLVSIIIAASAQLFSGLSYYIYMKKNNI